MDFTVGYMVFGLKLLCLFLNCFAENPYSSSSKNGYTSLDKEECPVVKASAMSKIFFCWMFPFMRAGFQRDIQESDLWPLDPALECDSHMPQFDRLWKLEVDRCVRSKENRSQGVEFNKRNNRVRSRSLKGERQRLLDLDDDPRIS
ncbi:hypothetical protein EGW08_002178, partial [Elysia chlorotica]